MPAAVVDGNPGRWKIRIGKCPDGDAHAAALAFFGVEDGRPADRTEPESEPGALVAGTDVFGGGSEDLERPGEAGQGREDAAGSLLAGEAMANTDAPRLAFDLDAQLSAKAGGCTGRH